MVGNKIFTWLWIPARGHSGGLAMGVNHEFLEVEHTKYLQYSLWVLVRNRLTNIRYWVGMCTVQPITTPLPTLSWSFLTLALKRIYPC